MPKKGLKKMTDAEFTSYTIIEFPSEAEMEFFLSERISKSASLRDSMKKSGMKKWVTSRIFNKENKFVIANWLEYESQEAYETCNEFFEHHIAKNRNELSRHTVKIQSYRGIVIFEQS